MKIEIKKSLKLVDYNNAMKLLEKRVQGVINGEKPELLWILEHKPIFTAGTSYKESEILNKNIKIVRTSRGGKITYHGPGQKVIYFVLDLNIRGKNIKKLIGCIEKCIIQILREFKIKSFSDDQNIGIWVNVNNEIKKIAAIGIKVKKWVAYHGFCINISNNLEVYKNIIPCGISNKGITNLSSISNVDYKEINEKIIKVFLNTFK